MKLRLPKLQDKDKKAKSIKTEGLSEDWEDVEEVLQYQGFLYVLEMVCSKVVSCHHNDLFAGHFGIDKTRELLGWKYYWPSLRKVVESYV